MAGKPNSSSMRWTYPKIPDPMQDPKAAETSMVPELLHLGCQKYAEAYPLSWHRHDDGYEFVFVEHGIVTWEIDGVHFPTSAGHWFYTCPDELHKPRFDYMEPSRIWWMIIKDPGGDPNWFRLEESEREFITSQMRQLPRVFRAAHRVREQLARLKAALEMDGPEKKLFARHQVQDILFGMLQPVPARTIDPGLKKAVIHLVSQLAKTPEKRVSNAEMARAVQISESHFYKLFHEVYGQSPAAYMERIRMERACDLLKTNISITEVALELGFNTSQHFATAFKKLIGSPPSEWRLAIR